MKKTVGKQDPLLIWGTVVGYGCLFCWGKVFGKIAIEFAKNGARSNPKIAVLLVLGSLGIAWLSGTAIYAIKKDYNVKFDGGVSPGRISFTLHLKNH